MTPAVEILWVWLFVDASIYGCEVLKNCANGTMCSPWLGPPQETPIQFLTHKFKTLTYYCDIKEPTRVLRQS